MSQDPDLTCISLYKIPIDPAISFYYYVSYSFAMESSYNPWTWVDESGISQLIKSINIWGKDYDYQTLYVYFQNFKEIFVDKGYPIIISEVGVLTEDKKDINSIREYLYSVFSISRSFGGIMACLLDTSNKKSGIMNYYDRINDKWYDEVIRDNFKKISQGNFVKLTDFSYYSNKDIVTELNNDENLCLKFGNKKIKKVIFKVKISNDYNFGIFAYDKKVIFLLNKLMGMKERRILMVHILILLMLVKEIIMIILKFRNGGIPNIQL